MFFSDSRYLQILYAKKISSSLYNTISNPDRFLLIYLWKCWESWIWTSFADFVQNGKQCIHIQTITVWCLENVCSCENVFPGKIEKVNSLDRSPRLVSKMEREQGVEQLQCWSQHSLWFPFNIIVSCQNSKDFSFRFRKLVKQPKNKNVLQKTNLLRIQCVQNSLKNTSNWISKLFVIFHWLSLISFCMFVIFP